MWAEAWQKQGRSHRITWWRNIPEGENGQCKCSETVTGTTEEKAGGTEQGSGGSEGEMAGWPAGRGLVTELPSDMY